MKSRFLLSLSDLASLYRRTVNGNTGMLKVWAMGKVGAIQVIRRGMIISQGHMVKAWALGTHDRAIDVMEGEIHYPCPHPPYSLPLPIVVLLRNGRSSSKAFKEGWMALLNFCQAELCGWLLLILFVQAVPSQIDF